MNKPIGGLGRGLGSLIQQNPIIPPPRATAPEEIEVAADGSLRVQEIDPALIEANPYQPRRQFKQEELDDLMASIKEHGILQPLVVTKRDDGKFELIAGERRLRASRGVGLTTVPVIVREADNRKKLEWAIIENVQRQDLNAVEEAVAYRQLMDEFNLTQEQVSQRVGKSRPQIANTLRLLDLDGEMLDAVKEGKITRSHARTLLAEENTARRQELFDKMLGGGVTVRNAEETVRTYTRHPRVAKDANLAEIERTLREKMGTKVEIKMNSAASGTVIVHFYSKDDLKALLEHLG